MSTVTFKQETIDQLANLIVDKSDEQSIKTIKSGYGYSRYRNDPIAFGKEIFGESYTEDVEKVIDSVLNNSVTIVRSANGVGKTHIAARLAIWFYKVFDDAQVYTAAAPPEDNLKKLLWGEIGGLINKHPHVFKNDKLNVLHIERTPRSFLTGVTIPTTGTEAKREATFSGKHAPHLMFEFDEGDAIPNECYRGADSCMSGGMTRFLILLNPRSEVGPVYEMERDQRAHVVTLSAFNHPNVVTGDDIISGAVTREKTVKRINLWTRPLLDDEVPDAECFKLPEYLIGVTAPKEGGGEYDPLKTGWYKIEDPAFSYMVLGQYPAQSSAQLISRTWINAARSRWDAYVAKFGERPPIGVTGVQGLDIAEFGVDSNVSCLRYGGWVPKLKTWSGMDIISTAKRGIMIHNSNGMEMTYNDATGVGAGVAPYMRQQGCSVVAVMVASSPTMKIEQGEFNILRDQLWWLCREWLRIDSGAMLPPDKDLIEELATPRYEVKNGKIKVMSKDDMKKLLKRSPDRADALCLTFHPKVMAICAGSDPKPKPIMGNRPGIGKGHGGISGRFATKRLRSGKK